MEMLNLWCGETSSWNTEKKVIAAFKDSPLWAKWAAASNNPRRSEKYRYCGYRDIAHIRRGLEGNGGYSDL